jgi:hypothetical protein
LIEPKLRHAHLNAHAVILFESVRSTELYTIVD